MQINELEIIYIKNERVASEEEKKSKLARFIYLFAQIGLIEDKMSGCEA